MIKGPGFVIILFEAMMSFLRRGLEFLSEGTGVFFGEDWSFLRRGLEFSSERTGAYSKEENDKLQGKLKRTYINYIIYYVRLWEEVLVFSII